MSASYGLILAGGIITLLAGILVSAFGALITFFVFGIGAVLGVWGIVLGILLIFSAQMIGSKKNTHSGNIIALIFSVLGLISLQGFVIGPLLSLIGSIIGLTEKRKAKR